MSSSKGILRIISLFIQTAFEKSKIYPNPDSFKNPIFINSSKACVKTIFENAILFNELEFVCFTKYQKFSKNV